MHPCWMKVLISLKNLSDSKRLNGSFSLSFNRVEDTSFSASLVWKCAHDGSTAKSS